MSLDSFNVQNILRWQGSEYYYYDLNQLCNAFPDVATMPKTLKLVLENLLYHEDGNTVTRQQIERLISYAKLTISAKDNLSRETLQFYPSRLLLDDVSGFAVVRGFASLRNTLLQQEEEEAFLQTAIPVQMVVDHSVSVNAYGNAMSCSVNLDNEYECNAVRYSFLKWADETIDGFDVIPPGRGIGHQINIEHLASVINEKTLDDGKTFIFAQSVLGGDKYMSITGALGILGWQLGMAECQAASFGLAVGYDIPEVVGVEIINEMQDGVTIYDAALTLIHLLGKAELSDRHAIEFYGDGVALLSIPQRATLCHMAMEAGVKTALFPIDDETINYMEHTGRERNAAELLREYAKVQGLWRDRNNIPNFSRKLQFDLSSVMPCLAGPEKPTAYLPLTNIGDPSADNTRFPVENEEFMLQHGDIVMASISGCNSTISPYLMLTAGLLARKAREKGLNVKPWIKTTFSVGSSLVLDYLTKADLYEDLCYLGFDVTAFGCAACIGQSGTLQAEIREAINKHNIHTVSVISGSQNITNPDIESCYLASPPLIVAYALLGNINKNIITDPIGQDFKGDDIFLKDIWPSSHEVGALHANVLSSNDYIFNYSNIFNKVNDTRWNTIKSNEQELIENIGMHEIKFPYVSQKHFMNDIILGKPIPLKVKIGLDNHCYDFDFKDSFVIDERGSENSISDNISVCQLRTYGVRCILADEYTDVQRKNLIGYGIIPLIFDKNNVVGGIDFRECKSLYISNQESISSLTVFPQKTVTVTLEMFDGTTHIAQAICDFRTRHEVSIFEHGGVLGYVYKQLTSNDSDELDNMQ